jgi:hypothetical protein
MIRITGCPPRWLLAAGALVLAAAAACQSSPGPAPASPASPATAPTTVQAASPTSRASVQPADRSPTLFRARSAQAISPRHDVVKGTAEHLGADPPFAVSEVRIDARSAAAGGKPRGYVVAHVPQLNINYRGRVTCLNVVGNEATVGIEIVKSEDPSQVGLGQLISVVDGAETGEADRIAGHPVTAAPPVECPFLSFNVPVISGDYVVHDATE